MQSETSKQCTDAAPCSLRDLVHELEDEGMIDTTLHGHTLERPAVEAGDGTLQKLLFTLAHTCFQGGCGFHLCSIY